METKTVAALCIGQPVKYVVKKDRKLDDCWIAEQVVLHTFKIYKDKMVMITLGNTLLWACFYAETQYMVPL